jgi:predicted amidohydrolase
MQLAIVQTSPQFGEKEKNMRDAMSQMASSPADFYVLPELFTTGYNFENLEEVAVLAEPFSSGQTAVTLSDFCVQHECAVVYGFAEEHQGKYYNSAAFIGPDATMKLYRKIHLYDREKLFFAPGNLEFPVLDTPWGRIGIMICFDWFFPESTRTLALKGAQFVAHPSNLVMLHCPGSMPVRCRENRIFVATANRVGIENRGNVPLTFIGQSQLTAPSGEILYRASSDQPQIWRGEITLAQSDDKQLNSNNHVLHDRRPEFYL